MREEERAAVRRRGQHQEGGASLVEFALVIPLLTLFLFGIVQFGIAYDKQQSINSGAREGARLGALPTSALGDIATRAVESSDLSAVGNDPKVVVADEMGTVVGVRCAGGTYSSSDDCASPTVVDATEVTLMPCGASPPSEFVKVTVSIPYDITIPLFGVQTVNIDAEAEFRCE